MSSRTTAVINELLGWRFIGAAVWHGMSFTAGYTAWSMIAAMPHPFAAVLPVLSFPATATLIGLLALQLCVLFAKNSVLSASESPPLYLPAFGLHSRGWAGLLISRVLLRTRKLQDFFNTLTLLAATCATAITTLYLQPQVHHSTGSQPGFTFSVVYGLCLGCLYTVEHLARCRDVLVYPTVHRHRLYRLRQRLPACVLPALKVSVTALLLAALAGQRPQSLAVALTSLHAGSLCVWGWLAAHAVLEVVATEPLRLTQRVSGTQDPVRCMLEALADGRGMVQDLSLQELCGLAEGHAAQQVSWRASVWADESGQGAWTPLAGFLVAELRDWVMTLAAALPGAPGAQPLAVPTEGVAKVRWNVAALSSSTGTQGISRAQDTAAWAVRAKHYKIGFCLRALSSLAARSRAEDRYGVVLMSAPTLGDITVLLLSTLLATQQYTKTTGTHLNATARVLQRLLRWSGPVSHPTLQQAEVCCYALEDLARGCAYRLVTAFGAPLQAAVKEASVKPPYGSPAELQLLLSALIAYRE